MTKSSERVRTFLPLWTVWVTVPLLALAPLKGVLAWVSPAQRLVTAAKAKAVMVAKRTFFIVSIRGLMFWLLLAAFLSRCALTEPFYDRWPYSGALRGKAQAGPARGLSPTNRASHPVRRGARLGYGRFAQSVKTWD